MSAQDAFIDNPITLNPDMSVQEAIEVLETKKIRCAPVVDSAGNLVGMFGLHSLMEDLLPLAARIQDGMQSLDFTVGSTPAAAKRIRKLAPKPLREHMDKVFATVNADTAMMEVILRMVKHGSPLPVVGHDGKKFLGLVSEQSCLHTLYELLKEIEAEEGRE